MGRLILFLLSMALLLPSAGNAQVSFLGTRNQVNASIFKNNMQQTLQLAMEGSKERSLLVSNIQRTRKQYWQSVKEGKETDYSRAEYLKYLRQKDFYLLYLAYMDKLSRKPDEDGDRSGEMGVGQAFDIIFGQWSKGELDGGVLPIANSAFNNFIYYATSLTITGNISDSSLNEVNEAYANYCIKRDIGEYLFKNQESPLYSKNPETYLSAWLMATEAVDDYTEAQEVLKNAKQIIGVNRLQELADAVKKMIPIEEFYENKKLYSSRKLYHCLENFDWELAKINPAFTPVYHIKRHSRIRYDQAAVLLKLRQKRHGDAQIKRLTDSLNAYLVNGNLKYGGKTEAQLDGYYRSAFFPVNDGLAEYLGGQEEKWKDMLDYGTAQLNKKDYRTQLITFFNKAEKSTGSAADITKRYAAVMESLDEKLFLTACAAATDFPAIKMSGHAREYSLDKNQGKEKALENCLRMFYGISTIVPNKQSFAILLLRDEQNGTILETLEKAITEYKKICNLKGKDIVLAAAKTTSEQAAPFLYQLKFYNPYFHYRLTEMLETPLGKFRSLLDKSDDGELLALTEKYKKEWAEYEKSPMKYSEVYPFEHPTYLRNSRIIFSNEEFSLRASSFKEKCIHSNFYLVFKVDKTTRILPDQKAAIRFKELIKPIIDFNTTACGYPVQFFVTSQYTEEQIEYLRKNHKMYDPLIGYRPLSNFTYSLEGDEWKISSQNHEGVSFESFEAALIARQKN